jgi:hypothetical protein
MMSVGEYTTEEALGFTLQEPLLKCIPQHGCLYGGGSGRPRATRLDGLLGTKLLHETKFDASWD